MTSRPASTIDVGESAAQFAAGLEEGEPELRNLERESEGEGRADETGFVERGAGDDAGDGGADHRGGVPEERGRGEDDGGEGTGGEPGLGGWRGEAARGLVASGGDHRGYCRRRDLTPRLRRGSSQPFPAREGNSARRLARAWGYFFFFAAALFGPALVVGFERTWPFTFVPSARV